MIKNPKKVDIRISQDLYDELNFIVAITGAKRSSWIRGAIEERVNLYKLENSGTWEDDYEQFKAEQKRA